MRALERATQEGEGSRIAGLCICALHVPREKVLVGPHL